MGLYLLHKVIDCKVDMTVKCLTQHIAYSTRKCSIILSVTVYIFSHPLLSKVSPAWPRAWWSWLNSEHLIAGPLLDREVLVQRPADPETSDLRSQVHPLTYTSISAGFWLFRSRKKEINQRDAFPVHP